MEKIDQIEVKQKSKFFNLPYDVIKMVFKGFTDEQLLDVAITCKQMHSLISQLYLLTTYGKTCRFLEWYNIELGKFSEAMKNYEQSLQVSLLTPSRLSWLGRANYSMIILQAVVFSYAMYLIIDKMVSKHGLTSKNVLMFGLLLFIQTIYPIIKRLYNNGRQTNSYETQRIRAEQLDETAIVSLKKILFDSSCVLLEEDFTKKFLEDELDENLMFFLALKAVSGRPQTQEAMSQAIGELARHLNMNFKTFTLSRSCLRADYQSLLMLEAELKHVSKHIRLDGRKSLPLKAFSEESQQRLTHALTFWNVQQSNQHRLNTNNSVDNIVPLSEADAIEYASDKCSLTFD